MIIYSTGAVSQRQAVPSVKVDYAKLERKKKKEEKEERRKERKRKEEEKKEEEKNERDYVLDFQECSEGKDESEEDRLA